MNNKVALTTGGISLINQLDSKKPKGEMEVNYVLQIMNIKSSEKNTDLITCEMGDSVDKYLGFLIICDNQKPRPQIGDIIRLNKIQINHMKKDQRKIYIIKSYDTLTVRAPLQLKVNQKENKIKKCSNYPDQNNEINNSTSSTNIDIPCGSKTNNYIQLSHLTTFSKEIVIFVKITKKFDLKNFTNRQTQEQNSLLSFNVIDEEGYEMQITAFGKCCEKLNNTIKEGCYYEIKGGYVKVSDKKYCHLRADYKIIIDDKTIITEKENKTEFKDAKLEISKLDEITTKQVKSIIDIIAYVIEVNDKTTINTKLGERFIRKIIIGDISGYKVELTLWSNLADLDIKEGQIISLQNVSINEYNGRNLSSLEMTKIQINPNIEEAKVLKEFINKGVIWNCLPNFGGINNRNDTIIPQEISYIKEVVQLLDNSLDDKTILCKIKGTITYFKNIDRNYYGGCPEKTCKKKVKQQDDGTWLCETCNKTYEKPKYYYTFSVLVKDASEEHFIDFFGDLGKTLLGCGADEYKNYIDNQDLDELNKILDRIEYKSYIFVCRPKNHIYNNVVRKKFSCINFEPLNYQIETNNIAKELEIYLKN